MSSSFELERFVIAQDAVLPQVRQELRAGCKRSHWMWFVFPQLAGLGQSAMAQRYAIAGLDEARAYMAHPALGPRLVECANLVNQAEGRSVQQIFGSPDDMKFHSSMTLFSLAQPHEPGFRQALERCFGGAADQATMALLGRD